MCAADGYTPQARFFLKLSFTTPNKVPQAAAFLHAGRVQGRSLPPYEAHVPFMLQFMIDHNICGMDLLSAYPARERGGAPEGLMFRHPLPAPLPMSQPSASEQQVLETGLWLRGRGWIELHSEEFERQTRCELEADVKVQSLVNPEHVTQSAFTVAGDRTAEQRLVQSLATIWQQSRADAGSQTQSEFPKLGHIMVTQPTEESRDEYVPPTEDELMMQANVAAMVDREETARQEEVDSPGGTPSVSQSEGGQTVPESPNISWTPFLEGLMSQSQALSQDLIEGRPDASSGEHRASVGFSASEARVSLEGGLASSAEPATAPEGDGTTHNGSELEDLLDWMRNDDGNNEDAAAAASEEVPTFGGPEAAMKASLAMLPPNAPVADDPTDVDGWTKAEREECANIMASQYQSDGDDEDGDEEEEVEETQGGEEAESVGDVQLPQTDGTDDSTKPRRAKRSKNDRSQLAVEVVKASASSSDQQGHQKRKRRSSSRKSSDQQPASAAGQSPCFEKRANRVGNSKKP